MADRLQELKAAASVGLFNRKRQSAAAPPPVAATDVKPFDEDDHDADMMYQDFDQFMSDQLYDEDDDEFAVVEDEAR